MLRTHRNATTLATMTLTVAALVIQAAPAATITHQLDATSGNTDNAGSPAVTVNDLTTLPTASLSGSSTATISVSGSFDSTIVGAGDSYSFTATSYDASSFDTSTSNITSFVDLEKIATRENYGWGEGGSFSDIQATEALVLTFDLSGLPNGVFLRLTEAVVTHWNADPTAQIIANGRAHTSVSLASLTRGQTATLSDLNFKIEDGDQLIFRGADSNPAFHGFYASSFTVEALIPEPASFALVGVGGVLLLRRRHRG